MEYGAEPIKQPGTTAAIVLSAGAGKRMNSSTKKQYMEIHEKPVIYYALKAFQESFVDEIVLVVSPEDISYCRDEIVNRFKFTKVSRIVEGGRERYHSVAAGLGCLKSCDYVFIHDGARPMITGEILDRAFECVKESSACVTGMPVKDTIKIADQKGYIENTPDRDRVWLIQTPQVFSYPLISRAYESLLNAEKNSLLEGKNITDDAMVVETFMKHPVKLVKGSYENIKITTPEDLKVAESFLDVF